MLLKIASLVVVLLITFFQSTTGMFSALIMFVLTVISAGLAFGTYEMLYNGFLGKYLGDYGHAAALIAVFLIVLIGLRLLIDFLIKKNPEFPGIVDRLGAAVFGFGSAMILTGMLAIGLQLLPFDAEILGFNRLVKKEQAPGQPAQYAKSGLWFSPDGFTVKLISMLSRNSFSGQAAFTDLHPDFLEELQLVRNGPQKESRHAVPRDVLSVQAVWRLDDERFEGGEPARREPGYQWLCVRTRINSPQEALDKDKQQRFSPMQVRLVGWSQQRNLGPLKQHTPVGLAMSVMEDTAYGDHRVVAKDQPCMIPPGSGGHPMDFVFDVPENFVPWFLAYKRGGRAEIPERLLKAGPPQPKIIQAISQDEDQPPPSDSDDEDRVPGRFVHSGGSRFDRSLPVPLEPDWVSGSELDLSGSRFRKGHGVADWPEYEAEPSIAMSKFFVPPGMRLFQLSITRDEAKSIYGRALQFTRTVLAQYTVIDERGNRYHRIGEIRVAQVGGTEKVEIQYWPQAEMPERCIRSPRVIQNANLTGNYTLIYLFLIPDDRTPQKFDTGNRVRMLQ